MNENDVKREAASYGVEHFPDLGRREWRAHRFSVGWLMTPLGDDLTWNTGVGCLVILDDGTIHEESSSLPPDMLTAKYEKA